MLPQVLFHLASGRECRLCLGLTGLWPGKAAQFSNAATMIEDRVRWITSSPYRRE